MSWRKAGVFAAVAAVGATVVAGVITARDIGGARAVREASGPPVELAGTDPITGARVDLAEYRGKPVVVNVWASWCSGCNEEAADLAALARAHPDIQVLGLNIQDTRDGARSFYRRWDWRHPSISDPQGKLAARLGLQGMPSTYVLDDDHRVVARVVGATDLAGFEAALRHASG